MCPDTTPRIRWADRERWRALEIEILAGRYAGNQDIAIATHHNYREAVRAIRSALYTIVLAAKGIERADDWLRVAVMSIFVHDNASQLLYEIGAPFERSRFGWKLKGEKLCRVLRRCPGQPLFRRLYPQRCLKLDTRIGVCQRTIESWLHNNDIWSEMPFYLDIARSKAAQWKEWARLTGSYVHTDYWKSYYLNARLRDVQEPGVDIATAIEMLRATVEEGPSPVIDLGDTPMDMEGPNTDASAVTNYAATTISKSTAAVPVSPSTTSPPSPIPDRRLWARRLCRGGRSREVRMTVIPEQFRIPTGCRVTTTVDDNDE